MDPIGVSQIITVPVPNLPAPSVSSSGQTPAVSQPDPNAGAPAPVQVDYNAQAAEQSRAAALRKASEQVANLYVLGDQQFTIFKDTTGQYITRYTSLKDGKVTYIPEPSVFKLGGSSGSDTAPVLNITA